MQIQNSVSERVRNPVFSAAMNQKRLWLDTAFINSTEMCVIGYNAQRWTNKRKKKADAT